MRNREPGRKKNRENEGKRERERLDKGGRVRKRDIQRIQTKIQLIKSTFVVQVEILQDINDTADESFNVEYSGLFNDIQAGQVY